MPSCAVCGSDVAPTRGNIRHYNQSGIRLCSLSCRGADVKAPKVNNVDRAVDRRPSMTEALGLDGFDMST